MKTYAPVSIVSCNSLWAASTAQLAVPELLRDLGRNLSLPDSLLKTSLVLPTSSLKEPVDWGFGCDCCAATLAKYPSRPGGSGKGIKGS